MAAMVPPMALATVLGILGIVGCASDGDFEGVPETTPGLLQRAAAKGLVDIREVDPTIAVELRYATDRNAANQVLYVPDTPCLVRNTTARRLAKAQSYLRARGYGLKIWDAYRPPEVQQELWLLSGKKKNYVGNPMKGWSAHCTGTAVDVTLVDASGSEVAMPSDFDVLGTRAQAFYTGGNPQIRHNVGLLQRAMEQAGFLVYFREWWHFSDTDYKPLEFRHVVFAPSIGMPLPFTPRMPDLPPGPR